MSITTQVFQQGPFMSGPHPDTTPSLRFTLNSPADDGDLLVFWTWNGSVTSVEVENTPVRYILKTGLTALVGSTSFEGNLCFVRLSQNDEIIAISMSPNVPGEQYLVDLWTLRYEARIPELYVMDNRTVGAGVVLESPAFTLPTTGNALVSAFNDTSGFAGVPGYYSYSNSMVFMDFEYTNAIVLGQPEGTTAVEPWLFPATTVRGTVNIAQTTCIDRAVESGLAYVEGAATIQVPHAGAPARYINPIPATLHAVPPTPSPIAVPTPPWVERSGQPFRKRVT